MTYLTPCPSCGTSFTPERRKMHLCSSCRLERQRREQDSRDRRREELSTPVPCLLCGKAFRTLAGSGKFCSECGPGHKRNIDRERKRERKEEESDTANTSEWLRGSLADLRDAGHADLEGVVNVESEEGRQLIGSTTPAGPEIGFSTYDEYFRGLLSYLRREACRVSWWREIPHWAYKLDTPYSELGIDLTRGLKCGDQRGTQAGYQRHKYAKEAACPECAEANREHVREYMRKYRAAKAM